MEKKESIPAIINEMGFVQRLTESEVLKARFEEIARNDEVNGPDYTFCRRYISMQLLYRNSQRPGTIINMTVEEANQVQEVHKAEEMYAIVNVKEHKTSLVYGSAKLVMSVQIYQMFKTFWDHIRPQLGYMENWRPLFITTTGQKPSHISTDIKQLAAEINESVMLGPTAVRKATSSLAAGSGHRY